MNNKKLAAFTLVEALIGVIIMMIVIGGIALSIKMGIDMYGRAEAHSELINGMRFTLDSFNREISPMLDVTREVEILSTDISNIPSVSDDNHYIYLENGSLTHRSKSGDKILTGSEYIDRVAFSYPTDTKETGENYTLRMNLTAKHERYGDTEYNTTLEKAMYNLPSKRGDNGNILRFKYSELEVIAEHLRIYNLPMDISNTIGNKKGITATASYDLVINPTPDRNYKDVSLIEWFISGSIKAPEEITEEIPTEDNSDIGYWRLMTEKNGSEPLTGIEIDTKKDFYSKDNNGTTWKAGVLKYRITPMLADDNGEIVLTGTPVWGPFADIVSNTDGLWDRWSDNLLKNITDDPNYITRNDGVDIYTYPTAGTKIVRINPNNTNNASSIYANVQLDLLKNEREFSRNSKGNNGTAFTTITNYSLIVDAKIYDGSGYGIFINGRIFDTKAKKIKDNGYVFQYDNDRHSFLIRLFGNSIQAAGDNTEIEELGSNSKVQGLYGAFPESVSLGNMDKRNETTEYTPRAMQNASFRVPESLNTYYHTRKRMLFTILEYYMYTNDDSGKKEPHYIIRMRTLKNANDVFNRKTLSEQQEIRKKDPWLIGKDFYDSEPIWFGDFVGETPIKQDGAYHLPIKNYGSTPKVVDKYLL